MKQYDEADLLEAKLHTLMVAGMGGHSGAYQTLLSFKRRTAPLLLRTAAGGTRI